MMVAKKDKTLKSAKAPTRRTLRLLVLLLAVVLLGGGYFFFLKEEPVPPAPKPPPKQVKKIRIPAATAPTKKKVAAPAPKVLTPSKSKPAVRVPQVPPREPHRYYTVEPGDTMWEIAGLPEVYGDHDMWRALYLANPGAIHYFYRKEQVPYVILSKGVRLRVPDKDEAKKMLTTSTGARPWVVQFASNLNLPYALALAHKLKSMGANVYVMEDRSSYPVWYVTRMGFFDNKEKAHEKAKAILKETGLTEYLVVPVSDYEIENYLPFVTRAKK